MLTKFESLNIPNGYSEVVNRRRTDSTVAKRKRTNNGQQNITQKTKDRATRTPLKPGWTQSGTGVNSRV